MSEVKSIFGGCEGKFPVFPRAIDGNAIEKFIVDGLNAKKFGYDGVEILAEIHNAPTIDQEELRPKGEWQEEVVGNGWNEWTNLICGCCGQKHEKVAWPNTWHYCPNCGADMRGKGHG